MGESQPQMKLSVVIPTMNEARYLERTVGCLRTRAALGPPSQILVSDSGSDDGTVEVARGLGVQVVEGSHTYRASALRGGVPHATGEVLLFLDADSIVPEGYDAAIQKALARPGTVAGAFEFALDGRAFGLRVVELINRVRYRFRRFYYGDQGVFVRAEALRAIGGYPDLEILESAELCRRLKTVGRLRLIRKRLLTSPRRFLEGGIYRVLGHDVRIWLRHLFGLSTRRFGPAYWEENQVRR